MRQSTTENRAGRTAANSLTSPTNLPLQPRLPSHTQAFVPIYHPHFQTALTPREKLNLYQEE